MLSKKKPHAVFKNATENSYRFRNSGIMRVDQLENDEFTEHACKSLAHDIETYEYKIKYTLN